MHTARFFAAATLSLGTVLLASWLLRSPLPHVLFPGLPAVHPFIALSLVILGTALLLLKNKKSPVKQRLGLLLGGVVLSYALVMLLDYLSIASFGAENWLFADQLASLAPPAPLGLMSILGVVFLAGSALFSWKEKAPFVLLSQVASLTVLTTSLLVAGNYLFSTSQQVFIPKLGYMHLHTALVLAVAAAALVFHTAGHGVFSPTFKLRVVFRNLAIGVKINVILLGIGAVITFISIGRSFVFYTNFADVTERHIPKLEASYELEVHAKEVTTDVYEYLAFHNPRSKQSLEENFTQLEVALTTYEQIEKERTASANNTELRQIIGELKETSHDLLALQDQYESPSTLLSTHSGMLSLLEKFDAINRELDTIINNEVQADIRQQTHFDRDVIAPSIIFSSMIIIALLVFAVWLGTILARLIIQPLKQLTYAANQVAAGNLNINLQPSSKDEIGQLTATFLTMIRIVKASHLNMEAEAERVKEQKVLLQTILDHMPIGVIFLEAKNGEIVSVNTQAQQLFAVSEIVVANNSYEMLFTGVFKPDGKPYPLEELPPTKSLQSGKPSSANDVTILRPDESKVTVKITAAPIQNYRQELESIVVLIEDVTKEHRIDRMKSE